MTLIIVMMLGILLVAGVVALYVAFPHRGEEVPGLPWIGDAMNRAADAFPVLEDEADDDEQVYRVFG